MKVTGQVIFRNHGPVPTKDGRKLMSVVGIIAVPEDFEFKGEHQYVITGDDSEIFMIHPETAIDRTKIAQGNGIGNLLTEPIWRY